MTLAVRAWSVLLLCLACCTGCGSLEGHPPVEPPMLAPKDIKDFSHLYSQNCAGCHGLEGRGSIALGLADPVYLTIADDATLRRVTRTGVPGTAMPAFAMSDGGFLTDEQIEILVAAMRRWAGPPLSPQETPPPYTARAPGDPKRGATTYGTFCARCHGATGQGGSRASSIVDPAFLAQVSDQRLRTTVIAGRNNLGAPDWRGNVPGRAMSDEEVTDVVAWLVAQRPTGEDR